MADQQKWRGQGTLISRADSINRALDQVGEKWCLLILQEVFLGINSFGEMVEAAGVSRGVLSNRLNWLQSVGCLRKFSDTGPQRKPHYHLTTKSIELYDSALMAVAWERRFYPTKKSRALRLTHLACGREFVPEMRCDCCDAVLESDDVTYEAGAGASLDHRAIKVWRRSSIRLHRHAEADRLLLNLVDILGNRWTANVVALALCGLRRFDQFLRALPIATNILTVRLRALVEEGIFVRSQYSARPIRYEYRLTEKGKALFPWFLALLHWGDAWCYPDKQGNPLNVIHKTCGHRVHGRVACSVCRQPLKAHQVESLAQG